METLAVWQAIVTIVATILGSLASVYLFFSGRIQALFTSLEKRLDDMKKETRQSLEEVEKDTQLHVSAIRAEHALLKDLLYNKFVTVESMKEYEKRFMTEMTHVREDIRDL